MSARSTGGPGGGPEAGRARSRRGGALPGLILFARLLAVAADYPVHWDPPHIVRNEVSRTADGVLRFGHMNMAASPTTPAWLDEARATEHIDIDLEARAAAPDREVSIMML